MDEQAIAEAKHAVRQRFWDILEREHVTPPGVHGHIPDFTGKEAAAERLAATDAWQAARVIKCNPARAQLPVRIRALHDGKLLYMAVPRLATPKPFYLLDPATLTVPAEDAATAEVAARLAETVAVDEMQPVDLIVSGSVAVDHAGRRIGKGAGYADIEVALLYDANRAGTWTTFATTVHHLQVVSDDLPTTGHDFKVDLIVTAEQTISCPQGPQKLTLIRDDLTDDKVQAIPVLQAYLEANA